MLRVLLVSFTNIYKSDIMNPSEYIVRFRSRADRLDLIRFAPHGLSFKADLKHYSSEGSAWRITKASAGVNSLQFDCCSPPYQDVVFTVTLQRLSAFDAKIAIGPATGNDSIPSLSIDPFVCVCVCVCVCGSTPSLNLEAHATTSNGLNHPNWVEADEDICDGLTLGCRIDRGLQV